MKTKIVGYLFALAVVLIITSAIKNTQNTGGENVNSENGTVTDGLKNILAKRGRDWARNMERLFRLETAHFKSGQYKKTNTAGMEIAAGKYSFPYGWVSLKNWADKKGLDADSFGTVPMKENGTGKTKYYISFPSPAMALDFLDYMLYEVRGQKIGSWYSLNPDAQQRYEATLSKIVPRIVNSL